jgi:hypothetical protein
MLYAARRYELRRPPRRDRRDATELPIVVARPSLRLDDPATDPLIVTLGQVVLAEFPEHVPQVYPLRFRRLRHAAQLGPKSRLVKDRLSVQRLQQTFGEHFT